MNMRRLSSVLGVLVVLVVSAAAQQQIYIPSNTPQLGTCDLVPFVAGDMRFHYLLKASDLVPGVPQKITDIAFAPCALNQWTAQRLQMRMARTTRTSLASCFAQNLEAPVIVYDSSITWNGMANKWSPIGLRWPFVTDGKLNVVVEIRFKGGLDDHPVWVHSAASFMRFYNYLTPDPFNAPCANNGPEQLGPLTRLTVQNTNMLLCADQVKLGQRAAIQLKNCPAGHAYQIATALGQTPIPVGGGHWINLTLDDVARASMKLGAPVFTGYGGLVDNSGSAQASVWVFNLPQLVGTVLYHAAITYTTSGVTGATNTGATIIRP